MTLPARHIPAFCTLPAGWAALGEHPCPGHSRSLMPPEGQSKNRATFPCLFSTLSLLLAPRVCLPAPALSGGALCPDPLVSTQARVQPPLLFPLTVHTAPGALCSLGVF